MPLEFVARNGLISQGNLVVSGSITSTGAITISGSIASASFASTASSADNFLARGTITAQTLVVQTITSSVSTITGSTNFGSSVTLNNHLFTGSVSVTGSLAVVTTGTELQVGATGVNIGNALTDIHIVSGSLRIAGPVTSSGALLNGALSGTSATFSSSINDTNAIQISNTNNGNLASGRLIVENNSSSQLICSTYSSGFGFPVFGITAANYSAVLSSGANSNGLLLGTLTSDPLIFGTNGAERMRISDTGNVGIGTTSPNYQLQVNSSTSISRIQLTNSSTGTASGDGFQVIADGVNATLSLPETGYMSFETSNSERMRITSGGNVGIGTSAVSSYNDGYGNRLVLATSGNTGLTFVSSTAGNGNIYFADGTTGDDQYRGIIAYEHANDLMRFSTNAVERMRITSGGNVLFSNPNSGNSVSTGNITLMSTATAINDRLTIAFAQTGVSSRARAGIGAVSETTDGYSGALAFYTRAAADGSALDTANERMRITSGGNVCINTSSEAGGNARLSIVNNASQVGLAIKLGASTAFSPISVFNTTGGGIFDVTEFGTFRLFNAITVPASSLANGGILYVEAGALKYRGSSGTITTIANA